MTIFDETVNINGRNIGKSNPTFLVAEIGLNHNHNIDLAKKMILSAKKSGADAVKFQTYITEELINKESDRNVDAFSMFKKLELSKDELKELSEYSKNVGITFFSTPFCIKCVDMLESINVPCYKISSMDINYFQLIQKAAQTQKPIIVSTGAATIGDIEKAIKVITKTGNNQIILLHCVSKYPPRYSEMNLKRIKILQELFPYPIGFSDHSIDLTSSLIARSLGAVMIEKHFTLDKNAKGPDHFFSSTPQEFNDLRKRLNAVDALLSSTGRERTDELVAAGGRRSLYAKVDIKKGTVITHEMISVIRPGNGIAPEFLPIFIGRQSKKDIKKGSLLELSWI